MAEVSDEDVRQEVRRILKGADLDSISERKIKDEITKKHGHIERYKDVIREEVESFLESIEAHEEEDEVKPPGTKRKAAGNADSKPQAKHQKKASTSGKAAAVKHEPVADGDEEEAEEEDDEDEDAEGSNGLPIKLSSNRRADVSEFKGTTLVNIREYYEVMPDFSAVQKEGELLPGRKGISLSPEQFNTLKESAPSIQTALTAEDADFKLALSARRCVRINVFKGTAMVDIREMYEKDGEERPGKKGISLNAEQWAALKKGLNKLNSAI